MEDINIEKLMESNLITILRGEEEINFKSLENMDGRDLLACDVKIRGHDVNFYEGLIPGTGYMSGKPEKFGIGYHYRNVGSCANKENETASNLIISAYGTSCCFDSEGRVIL